MTIYTQGARVEREHCHRAVDEEGAILSLRGAGSKSYSKGQKYKIDTIDVFKDRIRVTQHKKKGHIPKTEVFKLLELQRLVPDNVKVYVGDSKGIKHIEDKGITGLLFK